MITATDVIDFYNRFEKLGIVIWLLGGWGVDALLMAETRPHPDLDILIQWKDLPQFRGMLEAEGYKEIKLEIARPENFVLGHDKGLEIDVHVIDLNGDGNVVYRHADSEEAFPGALLTGEGRIASGRVKCISAEWQLKWHTGYKPRDNDFKDVAALCDKFGIEYPPEYAQRKEL